MYEARELNMAKVQLGSSIEWALIQRWKEEYPGEFYEIGEVECEGLFGTMDLLEVGRGGGEAAVHEMKLTWLSAAHDVWSDKLMKFWWQIKAYLHMTGLRVGVLHVWYVNGGGEDKYMTGDTEYREWRVRFEEEELRANWEMLKREEGRMMREMEGEREEEEKGEVE